MSLDRFKTPVVTASAAETVVQVARAMRDQGVGCVVVLRGGHPVGLLTDRDLVMRVLADGLDPESTRVEEVVTYDPITVSVDDGIETAAERMAKHGVRRLPLVDRAGHIVGMVTADDLLMLLGRELGAVCDAIANRSDAADSR